MAKLTTAERKALPNSAFAIPSERKYPVNDPSHAANAKARASEMEGKGRLSKATEGKIDRKADRKLGGNPRSSKVHGGHTKIVNSATHAEKLRHF